MKKIIILTFVLVFSISISAANAYTTYLSVDDTMDFNLIHGFQFDVIGANIADLTLSVFFQGTDVTIDGSPYTGAVPYIAPNYPWDVFATTDGVAGLDYSFGISPLTPGVILSLDGADEFSLSNFLLACNADPTGSYPDPFFVSVSNFSGGSLYTYTNVPIPTTLLLLGSGLVGIISWRRKRA